MFEREEVIEIKKKLLIVTNKNGHLNKLHEIICKVVWYSQKQNEKI